MRSSLASSSGRYNCPVELALSQLGGKWKLVLLACLKQGPHRYAELKARTPGLSDKVRVARLRELVASGLVTQTKRGRRGSPSHYQLSAHAAALGPALEALYAWGLHEGARLGASFATPTTPPKPGAALSARARGAARSASSRESAG